MNGGFGRFKAISLSWLSCLLLLVDAGVSHAQSVDGFSIGRAHALMDAANSELRASGYRSCFENGNRCRQVDRLLGDANDHIMYVFNQAVAGRDASGDCLRHDPRRALAAAARLRDWGNQFRAEYGGYYYWGNGYETISQWIDMPYCRTASRRDDPPARDTSCDSIDVTGGMSLPNRNIATITRTSPDECAKSCQGNPKCKSFDYNRINATCYHNDRSKSEVALLRDPDFDHYQCRGR